MTFERYHSSTSASCRPASDLGIAGITRWRASTLAVTLPSGAEAWMIAAADGSIVWLDLDGKLVDKFQVGQPLAGLALANRGEFGILLVSTPAELTAWKLTKK